MYRALVATAPRMAELVEYSDREITADEVYVRTIFASPKHGTDLPDFRGESVFMNEKFDPDWNIFVSREAGEARGVLFGSWNIGNMYAGRVVKAGRDVKEFAEGDLVVSYGPIRETQIAKAVGNYRLRKIPDVAASRTAMCYDPAQFALGAVRDANIRPGETVGIFGLGAIGLIAVKLCKLAGASLVVGFDPLPARRVLAGSWGADATFDPREVDAGLELKKLTKKMGVDAVIETSASPQALQASLRGLGYGGVIAFVGFGKEIKGGLNFGREAHFNNARIVFSRASSEPNPEYPRWSRRRIEDTVWEMLMSGKLACGEIITPIVSFDQCSEAYMKFVDREPDASVKMGVQFDA